MPNREMTGSLLRATRTFDTNRIAGGLKTDRPHSFMIVNERVRSVVSPFHRASWHAHKFRQRVHMLRVFEATRTAETLHLAASDRKSARAIAALSSA